MIWLIIALIVLVGVPLYVIIDELRMIRLSLEAANAIRLGFREARSELPDTVTVRLPKRRQG